MFFFENLFKWKEKKNFLSNMCRGVKIVDNWIISQRGNKIQIGICVLMYQWLVKKKIRAQVLYNSIKSTSHNLATFPILTPENGQAGISPPIHRFTIAWWALMVLTSCICIHLYMPQQVFRSNNKVVFGFWDF